MNIEQSVDILRDLVTVALTVSAPMLLVAVSVGVVVSLLQAVAMLVTYVQMTRRLGSDDLDDDNTCVPFAHVFRLFTVIQALNWSFYAGCILLLNQMLVKDADVDSGREMKPLV